MHVLEVNHVSVRYLTGDFKDIGLKEYVMRRIKNDYHVCEFWADKDINFTLEKGDMLGIVGTNGAGKSTILKVVSGIMEPSRGYVKWDGSIAALLELASGFDGELTVRENTYLRGAMLGFTREFMDRMYAEIISFAELEEFQDRPFKQLSSGMKSRLAFSIASLVEPQLLILDEVLAVGDGAFRQKSEAKMREIIRNGATTILVSHSVSQVEELCNKVLWLHKGEQIAFGETGEICALYRKFLNGEITIEGARALLGTKNKEACGNAHPLAEGQGTCGSQASTAAGTAKTRQGMTKERLGTIGVFLFAFFLAAYRIFSMGPTGYSEDARYTWEVIVSLAEGTPIINYVAYKGVFAFYPYIWLCQLARFLSLPDVFFVELYFPLLFACTAAVCMPNIYLKLTGKQGSVWRRALFVLLFFMLPRESNAYDQLMIDLPMLACFAGSASMLLNWNEQGEMYPGYKVIVIGFLFGIGQCFTGQYKPAYLFLAAFLVYTVWKTTKKCPGYALREKAVWPLFLSAMILPHIADCYFFIKIVNPLIAEGGSIFNKNEMVFMALLGGGDWYSLYRPSIGSSKAHAVYGMMETIPGLAGQEKITISALMTAVQFWASHPFDMLQIWGNRIFIALSMGARYNNVLYLAISYTAVFVTALTLKRQAKTLLTKERSKLLIYLAFLFAALVPSAMHMEGRYALQMQGLVLLFLSYDEYITNSIKRIARSIFRWVREGIRPDWGSPWLALLGMAFVLFCIIHFGTLMELQAIDGEPVTLFQFSWR